MALIDELRGDREKGPARSAPADSGRAAAVTAHAEGEAPDLLAELVEAAPVAGKPSQRDTTPEPVQLGAAGPAAVVAVVGPQQAPAVVPAQEREQVPSGGLNWRGALLGVVSVALLVATLAAGSAGGARQQAATTQAVRPPTRATEHEQWLRGLLN